MTYRSLLVLLDQDPSCQARVDTAIRLARSFDAHLVGIAPTGLIQVSAVPESMLAMGELCASATQALREQAEASAQAFRNSCQASGLPSFEAVVDEADPSSSLIRRAHCSDLTVLTRTGAAPGWQAAGEMAAKVVLESARPTLVLSSGGSTDTPPGRRVLVAWDDSREASRAVWDALPMLRMATQVHVTRWDNVGPRQAGALRERLQALRQWLARHGVAAEVGVEPAESNVATAIASRAVNLGADLIVMGAYGHARWTERLLGGATHHLLAQAPVALMMAH